MEPPTSFARQLKQERLKHGWSQADLAEKLGCDTKTIQRWENGNTPQPYYRQKLRALFGISLEDFGLVTQGDQAKPAALALPEHRENLDEAPEIANFCGRGAECAQLERWITVDRCRLVAILGMGGIGKTTLAARVVEMVGHDFTAVFWRTLKNAPPLASVLRQCLHFLAPLHYSELPSDREEQITTLIDALQKQRCLLILDNFETILQPGQRAGLYLPGYENYARLLQRLGDTRHHSCLLLTSREKPAGLARMESQSSPVRSLPLGGMPYRDGQELLKGKSLEGEEEQWIELIRRYGGNPLALKLVSESIREIFAGQIGEFLQEQVYALGDINDLLGQQFQRLSPQERELISWLAITREAVSLSTLRSCLLLPSAGTSTLDTLESLYHRSLIEKGELNESGKQPGLFLQPVILEYATTDLVRRACDEFIAHTSAESGGLRIPETWQRFAFLQAQAVDYIREIQQRMILGPVCDSLLDRYGQTELEERLVSLLTKVRLARLPDDYLAGNVLNILIYLRGSRSNQASPELRGFDFSHLSIRQAYLQDARLPESNFRGSSFRDTVFTSTFGAVSCVAFSPDGRLLAAGTSPGELWLYDVVRMAPRTVLHGHSDGIWALTFSPDGKTLASSSDDRTIRLWDLASGQCRLVLSEHTNRVRAVTFSPDGTLLVSGSNDQRICVWEIHTGRLLKTLRGHSNAIWSLAFHPSGHILASSGTDSTVRVWNLQARTEDEACLHVFTEHSDRVRAVAFSHDGSLLASASDDQTIRLWDIQEFRCLSVLRGHTNHVWWVAFHPKNRTLASAGEDGTIRFWRYPAGECFRVLWAHYRGVRSLAFSPDGELLASGGDDQAFRLWESRTGKSLKIVQGYTNRILGIDFTPTGQLVSTGDDQELRFWDTSSGRCLKILSTRGQGTRMIAASPDGRLLASVGGDQQVHLWNVETGQHLATLPHHTNWGWAVAFSPEGKLLASGGEDRMVVLWQARDRKKIQVLHAHLSWLRALAFSADSTLLASGDIDAIIYLWDVATGTCLKALRGHSQAVRTLAFHPTQKLLFSGSEDGTIRCWNTETGDCLRVLEGHTDRVLWIDMHPAGTYLASCSDDLSLRIWNLDNATCQAIPDAHKRRIRGLAYTPDGKLLASCSDDGTIKLWETASYTWAKTLIGERPYERMSITGATGLTEAQRLSLHTLGAVEEW